MGSWVERIHSKAATAGPGQARWCLVDWARWRLVDQVVPHLHADKPRGTTGEQETPHNPGFQRGEIKPQNLRLKKPVRVSVVEETPSLTGEFVGDPQGPRMYTKTWAAPPW